MRGGKVLGPVSDIVRTASSSLGVLLGCIFGSSTMICVWGIGTAEEVAKFHGDYARDSVTSKKGS